MNKELAFVFPGQGSQSQAMLAELGAAHRQVIATFEEASDVVGHDLWRLSREGSPEALAQTEITQPLMLAAGVAVWRVWTQLSEQRPAVMAGHSLGEYSALVAANALGYVDAVRLVAERARLMQQAVPAGAGAMAAILGLDDETVEAICREVAEKQVVSAANHNSPGQLVIAGEAAAVERAMQACLDAGARRAMKLPVSVPSHCALMRPAAQEFAALLDDVALAAPSVPVLHNVDVCARNDVDAIRRALVEQLSAPVRWTATVREMVGMGANMLAECGPGRVLSGLGRRIDKSAQWFAMDSEAGLEKLRKAMD
ncbi:MAG: [acyl-carrier-protein] S-malonyltransferase [Wenzhouxiangella sp.]|nr:MAG: [acyl-carrier-protein] S-malonyltransferase [Wenzhouxiangella sp.]